MTGNAADAPTRNIAPVLLVGFIVIAAVLDERLRVPLGAGGDLPLGLVSIVAPIIAILAIAHVGTWRSLGFVYNPVFMLLVLPYLVLTLVLPMLGALFEGYDVTTVWSSTSATTAASFLVIGAASSGAPRRVWVAWLVVAVAIQAAYAIGQAATFSGSVGSELFAPFDQWDLAVAGQEAALRSRSIGLYLNPNALGTWAAIAAVLCAMLLSGRTRLFMVTLAIVTLVVSQSRGASVALAVAAAAGIAMALVSGRISRPSPRTAIITVVLVLALIPLVAALVAEGNFAIRFAALGDVLLEGPSGDANLQGRVEYWQTVATFVEENPLGTWGPPILRTGSIDSAFFGHLAQGSIFYLASLILLLLAPLATGKTPMRMTLILVTIVVAVAGLTQNPWSHPPITLFWVLLGASLQWDVEHAPRRVVSMSGAPT